MNATPTHGPATVTGAPPGTPVQVLDLTGCLVTQAPAGPDGTAQVSGLAAGVYVVRVGSQALRLTVE